MTTTVFIDFGDEFWPVVRKAISCYFNSRNFKDNVDYCTYLAKYNAVRIADDQEAMMFVLAYKEYPITKILTDDYPLISIRWVDEK